LTAPVFSDDSGRRAVVLLWTGRIVVAVCGVLSAALALTMTTHIALPGLDRLVSPTLNQSRPGIKVAEDVATADGSDQTSATDLTSESLQPTDEGTATAGRATPGANAVVSESMRTAAAASAKKTSVSTKTSSGPAKAADARATAGSGREVVSAVKQGRGVGASSHASPGSKAKSP
jgi:hypothetical protein